MIRRYPNQEATMGEARLVGETGPDQAGNRLSPTNIKVSYSFEESNHTFLCPFVKQS